MTYMLYPSLQQPVPLDTVTTASWFVPLSEPRRFKRGLAVYDQPYYTAEPEPEELDVDAWFAPLSEPRRFPRGLTPGQQNAFTTSRFPYTSPYVRAYVFC